HVAGGELAVVVAQRQGDLGRLGCARVAETAPLDSEPIESGAGVAAGVRVAGRRHDLEGQARRVLVLTMPEGEGGRDGARVRPSDHQIRPRRPYWPCTLPAPTCCTSNRRPSTTRPPRSEPAVTVMLSWTGGAAAAPDMYPLRGTTSAPYQPAAADRMPMERP